MSTNAAVSEIVEKIATLSAMDLAELSKAIQDKFGVTPMAAVAAAPAGGAGAAPAAVEKTAFDVVLTGAGDKKIQVIKVVRELTGLGLKEAKDLVDNNPSKVKEGIPEDEAKKVAEKLREVGAQIEIK